MLEALLKGEVHAVLASELRFIVFVADAWGAKPDKIGFSFVDARGC